MNLEGEGRLWRGRGQGLGGSDRKNVPGSAVVRGSFPLSELCYQEKYGRQARAGPSVKGTSGRCLKDSKEAAAMYSPKDTEERRLSMHNGPEFSYAKSP